MSEHEVVYHVGAHKTASSLLQKYMRDHRRLLHRHGIYYIGRSEMNDCVGWGKKLLTDPGILRARVAEGFADDPVYRRLVTSHENTLGPPFKPGAPHLYPRGPELAEGLATALRDWPARVLLYIRPQDEFVESYYLQRIHQGRRESFADWLAELDLDALSWRPVADALAAHFGRDRVEVIDFGLIRQGQNAFIADFFRRVDPEVDLQPDYRPVRNPSISDKGLRIALAANGHLRTDWERKAMRKFLQKYFSNRAYPRPVLFTDAQKHQLRARYAAEYEELTGRPLAGAPD